MLSALCRSGISKYYLSHFKVPTRSPRLFQLVVRKQSTKPGEPIEEPYLDDEPDELYSKRFQDSKTRGANYTNLRRHLQRETNRPRELKVNKANPFAGNWKYLTGICVMFACIYYYSLWKVGIDDFSDVDAKGNIRTKLD